MRLNMKTVLLGMVCASVLLNADMLYTLEQKHGHAVPYTLAEDEVAVMNGSDAVLPTAKLKERTPSYRLLSADTKVLASSKNSKSKAGQVFYKYGQKEAGYRYVTTATVLVTFDKKEPVNLETFAKENGLEIVKTLMSNAKKEMVLFRNVSEKNDVELASTLTKSSKILSAKPNWILPVKLF